MNGRMCRAFRWEKVDGIVARDRMVWYVSLPYSLVCLLSTMSSQFVRLFSRLGRYVCVLIYLGFDLLQLICFGSVLVCLDEHDDVPQRVPQRVFQRPRWGSKFGGWKVAA